MLPRQVSYILHSSQKKGRSPAETAKRWNRGYPAHGITAAQVKEVLDEAAMLQEVGAQPARVAELIEEAHTKPKLTVTKKKPKAKKKAR